MLTYELVDNSWVIVLSKDKKVDAKEFGLMVLDFFTRFEKYPYLGYILGKGILSNLMNYEHFINYTKDKSGKVLPAPDLFRSFVNIALDNMQSAAYMYAWREACQIHDVRDGKGVREIEKLSAQAVVDLSLHLTGKPNLFGR